MRVCSSPQGKVSPQSNEEETSRKTGKRCEGSSREGRDFLTLSQKDRMRGVSLCLGEQGLDAAQSQAWERSHPPQLQDADILPGMSPSLHGRTGRFYL